MVQHRARLKAASEDGFGLIEVLVSSMVLIIVVFGALAAIDAVSSTAGSNQARTIAASLAEKDQERMRGLRTADVDQIVGLANQTETVPVGKVPYTIKSEARWVTDVGDSEGDISCATANGQGSYLRITSTVTSPVTGRAVKPVVLSSIVAPQPGKGTLVGKVMNSAGQPVKNHQVQVTGPTPGNALTNDAGCAVFPQREAGSYVLRLDTPGWVDPSGNPTPEKSATVSAGNVTTIEFIYDRKIDFVVKVRTQLPGVATLQLDKSTAVNVVHTGLPIGISTRTASPPGADTFTFLNMFPFATAYQIYSGSCAGNNPATYIPTYFATHPISRVDGIPGLPVPEREAIEPAIDVTVMSNSAAVNNATVYAYPKTAGCGTTRITMGQTNASGKLLNPGLPFGTYDLCAQLTTANNRTYRVNKPGINNTNPLGTSQTAVILQNQTNRVACAQ
jgi:hypothetical protein